MECVVVAFLGGVVTSACSAPSAEKPPPVVARKVPATPPADASVKVVPVDAAVPPTELKRFGITIELPAKTKWSYDDAHPSRAHASLGKHNRLQIEKVDAAPPKTLQQAVAIWARRVTRPDLVFETGKTRAGLFYGSGSYQQLGGGFYDSTSGYNVEMTSGVTRLFALMPLDAKSYVWCSIYLDVDADNARNEEVQRALEICLSLKRIAR